jgi:hypothetical protein
VSRHGTSGRIAAEHGCVTTANWGISHFSAKKNRCELP